MKGEKCQNERKTTAIAMPGFGAAYSDSDIAAVTNYVTTRFGTSASNLSAADIAKMRRETAQ